MPDNEQMSTSDQNAEFSAIFASILASVSSSEAAAFTAIADYPTTQAALKSVGEADIESFEWNFLRPVELVQGGLFGALDPSPSDLSAAQFLFTQKAFVERQFRWVIEQREGMSCCADKTRTIMRVIAMHFILGKPIIFNYQQEYTFHLPQLIFRTEEQILEFFTAVRRLHAGRPDAYLACLGRLLSTPAQPSASDAPSLSTE